MSGPGTSPTTGAIVIGRDYGALGVVRSLGRRDIPVWLLEEASSNASLSRYVVQRREWPPGEAMRLALLEQLAVEQGLKGWTVFPTSDESAALIARNHSLLKPHFRLTTPEWESLRWAYDKRLSHQLAESVGVDSPKTHRPVNRDDLALTGWTYPVIIKPSVKPEMNPLTAAKAWRVDGKDELLARYDEASTLVDPASILIQELIPGGGAEQFSFVALCHGGEPIAWMTARRTRQLPLDFGRYSTFVETVDLPDVEEAGRRLLAAMRFEGLVEVEFKRDPRSDRLKLLDINGRIWAWHTLGARAGIDFSYLQWRLSNGQRLAPVRARPGVRWMRGLTDLPAALRLMRLRELAPWHYLAGFRSPIEFALFALDDPVPWLGDVPLMAARHWRRRRELSQPIVSSAD